MAEAPPTLAASPTGRENGAARPIEAHGAIGDQRTVALVADDATVAFLCWPDFDSPSVFAALLDRERGGSFTLAPVLADARRRQTYLPDTNVLMTRFSAPGGMAEVTDFMPFPEPGNGGPRLVRHVRAIRGTLRFRLGCAPRLDYARADTRSRAGANGSVVFHADGVPGLRLAGSVALQAVDGTAQAEFTLGAGEEAAFMLLSADEDVPARNAYDRLLRSTVEHWRAWAAKSSYRGRWREAVMRSALTLKLLTSARHGSVLAAATFGLPEAPGGSRNWDYRATWIRDASFTVYAYMRLGYVDEANAFMHWVQARAAACGSDGSIQIMYGVDGGAMLDEELLPSLCGFGSAAAVRIGNAAHGQVQLDIYGELLDAGYLANKYGNAVTHEGWAYTVRAVDHVCDRWGDPDQGIWEMRGPPRHWLHSRVMCWVALDRAMRLAAKRSLPAPLARWGEIRDAIGASVWDEFWDEELGHFVAARGAKHVDGAMLMMPLVRFVSATDPRWLGTLDAIGRELVEDPLVYRYRIADGLDGREGAFTACSFWYAECLARANRLDEAQLVFEKMLGYASPLGLFSEEIGLSGEQSGNTPQALTHLALISAAFYVDRELGGPGERRTTWRP